MFSARFSILLLVSAAACKGSQHQSNPPQSAALAPNGDSDSESIARDTTLEDVLCRDLNNSYKCAQVIEQHALGKGHQGVRRRAAELLIPLVRGDTLSLHDSLSDNPRGVWYAYREYMPSINYHLIALQYYEGGTYLLVNGRTGKTTFSNGLPVVSPDARRLAAGNVDLEAEFSPTTLQIWRVELDSLALEFEYNFLTKAQVADSTWGPGQVVWLSPNEIRLTKEYGFGKRRGESIVRLENSRWSLVP